MMKIIPTDKEVRRAERNAKAHANRTCLRCKRKHSNWSLYCSNDCASKGKA